MASQMKHTQEIYVLPVFDRVLIHAPRHELFALANRRAATFIHMALEHKVEPGPAIRDIIEQLSSDAKPLPSARQGPLSEPFFLVIIPTRGCNLNCRYCDFAAPKEIQQPMSLSLARQAVNAYFDLLQSCDRYQAKIHFFGGEPFYAREVVRFVVEFARLQASQRGMTVHFEVTTNGLFSQVDCDWIGDHIDTVVLSLDGPRDIQDDQRPTAEGHSGFNVIYRNARHLSESAAELILRACVTQKSVGRLEEIAAWMSQTFRPTTICFEGLTSSPSSIAAGLEPPDPWLFARQFQRAASLLEAQSISVVLSTANVDAYQASVCPLGKDALIISPDGGVDACYLLRQDWERRGLDLGLGRMNGHGFEIAAEKLQAIRDFATRERPLCVGCFCRRHCAGGCHVNHPADAPAGEYDDLCIQTRLVSAARLLVRLGEPGLAQALLDDQAASRAAALQPDDRLCFFAGQAPRERPL